MNDITNLNPAELAAKEALDRVFTSISQSKSFILEAGAGAGKTESLCRTLKHLIKIQGRELLRKNQKIACITYTNVAKDEIRDRTDNNPVILSETIHSFCWSLIKNFQSDLSALVPSINEKWAERVRNAGGIQDRTINYDLGYPSIEEHEVLLYHDDVIWLIVKLIEERKFRAMLTSRYPILFIDEYQDTDKGFADALKQYFIETGEGPLIGLFGDHWQKIYGTGCGEIRHDNLETIGVKANFRSEKKIVECLNRIRKELPQEVCDPNSEGSVVVYQTNNWIGQRQTSSHWKDDLPSEVAHDYLEIVKEQLSVNGWDLKPERSKILMLTHNVLANEQGYRDLADVFSRNEQYIKKEDDYISFFADVLEPICDAYEKKNYGEMFSILGSKAVIRTHSDKLKWVEDMDALLKLRKTGTIGQIIEHLKITKRPRISEKIEIKESKIGSILSNPNTEISEDDNKLVERLRKLKNVSYTEVITLVQFIEDKTPFSTKHGVKGAEFENVVVVFGRGWNQYNFGQMLEWMKDGIPPGKQDTFERNRNLFYVVCSRPKKRLALLFTQKLSSAALETLGTLFGSESIHALD